MEPQLAHQGYKVALIGEALGATEAEEGGPFKGKAGFKLTRLIEWAGLDRSQFDIYNVAWCKPPNNELEGTSYELPAIAHCKSKHWGYLLDRARVLVPLGNVASAQFIGRKGILSTRGYIWPFEKWHVIPTVHPSYIQRGQAKWSAAVINDLQKAVRLAQEGLPPQVLNYELDPSPIRAYEWAKRYRERLAYDSRIKLAFDIETPGKGEDEDDVDLDSGAPDKTWHIERIGFSYEPLGALSIPWTPEHMATIRLLLESSGDKVVWNAGFDVPRIRRAGVEIHGLIHDGMVAWHILHSDLPKKLGFVATFTCPWQPAWKHLSGAKPAFYNATDADVELRSMLRIEEELHKNDLWNVYQRDVLDLEPILVHMHNKGMPIDPDIRLDRATKLSQMFAEVKSKLESCVPLEARKIDHVFVNPPKDTSTLHSRHATRRISVCDRCGAQKPRKDHFKLFKRKSNPCAGAGITDVDVVVDEYYRLAEFTPSRDQLIRYHRYHKRPLPMTFDKKTGGKKISFGEKQIKELQIKYPLDPLYKLVLDYRQIDKMAGTYIGRPIED